VSYEQIWAPWRLEYILSDKEAPQPDERLDLLPGADPRCFLCLCAADHADRQRLTVARGRDSVVVLNRYPYNNGHLLIAPAHHYSRLDEISDEVQVEMTRLIARMVDLLQKTLSPEGFNIGLNLGRTAGAGLPEHLHWHVVPRWTGDTNFMPSLAGVNVIPQSLEATWETLTSELARQMAP
jgi:ATP adenylyltransferase